MDIQKPGRAAWGVMTEKVGPRRSRASAAQRVQGSLERKVQLRQECLQRWMRTDVRWYP